MHTFQARVCLLRREQFGNSALGLVTIEIQLPQTEVSAWIIGVEAKRICISFAGLVPREQIHLHLADMAPHCGLVASHACFECLLESGLCLRTATLIAADDPQLVIVSALAGAHFYGGGDITVGRVEVTDSGVHAGQVEVGWSR